MRQYSYDYNSCESIFENTTHEKRLKCMNELLARNVQMTDSERPRWAALLTASLQDHTAPVENHRIYALIMQKWVYRDLQGIQAEVNDLYHSIMSSPGEDMADRLAVYAYEFSSDQFKAIASILFESMMRYGQPEPDHSISSMDNLKATYKNLTAIGKRLDESQKAQFITQCRHDISDDTSSVVAFEMIRKYNVRPLAEAALSVLSQPSQVSIKPSPVEMGKVASELFDTIISSSIGILDDDGRCEYDITCLGEMLESCDVATVQTITDTSLGLINSDREGEVIAGLQLLRQLFSRLDNLKKIEVARRLALRVKTGRMMYVDIVNELAQAIVTYADNLTVTDANDAIKELIRIDKEEMPADPDLAMSLDTAKTNVLKALIVIAKKNRFSEAEIGLISEWIWNKVEEGDGMSAYSHSNRQCKNTALESMGTLSSCYTENQAKIAMNRLLDVSDSFDEQYNGKNLFYNDGVVAATQLYVSSNVEFSREDIYFLLRLLFKEFELLGGTAPASYYLALEKMLKNGYTQSTIMKPLIEIWMNKLSILERDTDVCKNLIKFIQYMVPADKKIFVEKMMAYLCRHNNKEIYDCHGENFYINISDKSEEVYPVFVAALKHIDSNDAALILSKLPALHNKDYTMLVKVQLQTRNTQSVEFDARRSVNNHHT